MIGLRTLQYSPEGCVLALLAVFVFFSLPFFSFVNATTIVNFDE